MKLLLFIAAFALTLTACHTSQDALESSGIVSIKHGTSYGHCVGYCTREALYTAGSLVYTRSSRNADTHPDQVITQSFSDNDFNDLTALIDQEKWKKLPETIGCPDCADGGAEYIEITTQSGTRRVTFDAGSVPEGLEKALDFLRKKHAELEKAGSK